jgi:hypothetical protein
VKKVTSEIKIESGDMMGEFEVLQLQRKPRSNELPNLVKRAKTTKMPQLLKGFKPLQRR